MRGACNVVSSLQGLYYFQGSVKERPGTGLAMRATALKKLT